MEIPALVDHSMMANPRRVAVGLEQNRLAILLAVHHRHGGLQPQDLEVLGELGLAGELRPVHSGQERLSEAAKHGFRRAIVPAANVPKKTPEGMQIFGVKKLSDALSVFDDL